MYPQLEKRGKPHPPHPKPPHKPHPLPDDRDLSLRQPEKGCFELGYN